MKRPSKQVIEVVAPDSGEPTSDTLEWLADLLQREGTDLMDATFLELRRGTPVFVRGDADLVEVQRLMAKNHIRSIPVVEGGCVVGILDLVELALMEQDYTEVEAAP